MTITTALHQGDCFDILPCLSRDAFALVLADPPYGTTACSWDDCFDFERMWSELGRVAKERAALVFTASQPFTSKLICSNLDRFKCEWIWIKNRGSNFAAVKYQPFKEHESVLLFALTHKSVAYYPQKQPRTGGGLSRVQYPINPSNTGRREVYRGLVEKDEQHCSDLRYPSSWQKFNVEVGLHPTQKPVALMEYFVRTYSQPGELVLDFCMGSGTTGVACVNTGRSFVGIELDSEYYKLAADRIAEAKKGQLQ